MSSHPTAPETLAVNVDNFVRAESGRYFADLSPAGLNTWHHTREAPSVDDQRVVRLNRDTLYSYAVVDVTEGATLVLPEAGGRYQSAMTVNLDHYINRVFDRPGSYRLLLEELGTPHVLVVVRTLVDPADADDVAAATALQDGLTLEAPAPRPLSLPPYDRAGLDRTRGLLLQLAADLPDYRGAFGSRQSTEAVRHLIGAAAGWGGLPAEQATYLDMHPNLPPVHHTLTVGAVPVRAFWSVSVYNREGYFEKNALGRYSVNSVTGLREPDGTIRINLGGAADLPNQIPLPEGWNYTVRLYKPRAEILDGRWTFPEPRAAE